MVNISKTSERNSLDEYIKISIYSHIINKTAVSIRYVCCTVPIVLSDHNYFSKKLESKFHLLLVKMKAIIVNIIFIYYYN